MKCGELLREFEDLSSDVTLVGAPDIAVRIVYGTAQSADGTEPYEEVFCRADEEKDQKKKGM